jgi:hypothetical protein
MPPVSVRLENLQSMFLGRVVSVTSKQEPQGWFGQRCDMLKRHCRLCQVIEQ